MRPALVSSRIVMSSVALKNRLGPPLMFAFRYAHRDKDSNRAEDLRDSEGERVIARRRNVALLAITEKMLRDEVKTDLEQLMNTIALELTLDLEDFPFVRKSILNYGFPDLARRTLEEASVAEIGAGDRGRAWPL